MVKNEISVSSGLRKSEDNVSSFTYTKLHTYPCKAHGIRDYRGGRSSARETVSRVVYWSSFAKLYLKRLNIQITAYTSPELAGITLDKEDYTKYGFFVDKNLLRYVCPDREKSMADDRSRIEEVRSQRRYNRRGGDVRDQRCPVSWANRYSVNCMLLSVLQPC